MYKNIILLIISITFSLIMLELGLRYSLYGSFFSKDKSTNFYKPHSLYGWIYNEGENHIWRVGKKSTININSDGFRGIEIDKKLSSKKENYMFIGDSVTFGAQVEDNETFSSIVENFYENKINVFNFGVEGYSTDQIYLVLDNYIKKIKPSYIFYTFVLNDIEELLTDSFYHDCCIWGKPYFDENFILHKKKFEKKIHSRKKTNKQIIKSFLRNNFAIYRILVSIKYNYFNGNQCTDNIGRFNPLGLLRYANHDNFMQNANIEDDIKRQKYEKIINQYINQWERFELILLNMQKLAKDNSAKLILINFIEPHDALEQLAAKTEKCSKHELDYDFVKNKLKSITEIYEIPFINPNKNNIYKFQQMNNCTINHTRKNKTLLDGHYTVCGHQFHANQIVNFLESVAE
tara:strand:+ start:497 stop:1708 length:1212 start_codon:yes stop_codon:yes gene_type:complete